MVHAHPRTPAGCVIFGAKTPRLCAMMCLTAAVGFTINRMLSQSLVFYSKAEFVVVVASFGITLVANLYSRYTRDMSVGPLLAGILLMSPGSLGVKAGLSALGSMPIVNGNGGFSQSNFALDMLVGGWICPCAVAWLRGWGGGPWNTHKV